jgi:hypothetical protein
MPPVSRDGEEVGAALPRHSLGFDQPQVSFVDQVRRLQGVAGALPPQVAGRLAAQLLVDEREESFQRLLVARTPLLK